ncbi:hypothetical protein KBY23_16435 [Ruegeria pomeroyi]|nr:hypothetical protein [Ruegeria pomeroyi]
MLQRLENTRPYSHPFSPIPVGDACYELPTDFVNGLAFLRPIVSAKGRSYETQVNLLGGRLYALTTKLIVEYDAGQVNLPNWWFSPGQIPILDAFGSPPAEVFVDGGDLCFRWPDGQECLLHGRRLWPSDSHEQMAKDAFARFWRFDQGTEVTDEIRRSLRKKIGEKRLAPDIFLNGESLASRMSSNGKNWTFESSDPFPTNAGRTMRFDRQAFLKMIRVADEIDFSTSPVCFRHAHGRGMLVERTATSDTPDFGPFDD